VSDLFDPTRARGFLVLSVVALLAASIIVTLGRILLLRGSQTLAKMKVGTRVSLWSSRDFARHWQQWRSFSVERKIIYVARRLASQVAIFVIVMGAAAMLGSVATLNEFSSAFVGSPHNLLGGLYLFLGVGGMGLLNFAGQTVLLLFRIRVYNEASIDELQRKIEELQESLGPS
jgi:hypothetical protein